jgi:hypothetical protein
MTVLTEPCRAPHVHVGVHYSLCNGSSGLACSVVRRASCAQAYTSVACGMVVEPDCSLYVFLLRLHMHRGAGRALAYRFNVLLSTLNGCRVSIDSRLIIGTVCTTENPTPQPPTRTRGGDRGSGVARGRARGPPRGARCSGAPHPYAARRTPRAPASAPRRRRRRAPAIAPRASAHTHGARTSRGNCHSLQRRERHRTPQLTERGETVTCERMQQPIATVHLHL